jgi:DNA-binding LacI/PurR family transcriptional regulator
VQMGRMSVDLLLETVLGGASDVRPPTQLPVELFVRQSSGVVRAAVPVADAAGKELLDVDV